MSVLKNSQETPAARRPTPRIMKISVNIFQSDTPNVDRSTVF
jgi:hypothetical protein